MNVLSLMQNLLFGNDALSLENNTNMFQAVHKFIISTYKVYKLIKGVSVIAYISIFVAYVLRKPIRQSMYFWAIV